MGSMVKDTSAYQGAAAGVTDESVADAMMDSIRANNIDNDSTLLEFLRAAQSAGGLDTLSTAFTAQLIGLMVDSTDSILTDAHGTGAWTAAAGGSGIYADTIVLVDTSGTDVAVQGIKVEVRSSGSVVQGGAQWTDANGKTIWSLDADTYTIISSGSGYTFPNASVVVAGNASDTVTGYNSFETPSPAGGNLCTVYGWLRDIAEDSLQYADIEFVLTEEAYNTCDSTIIATKRKSVRTNAAGYFTIDLLKSSCMDDAEYKVTVSYNQQPLKDHTFPIPSDSTTYKLVF